jgi:uncharacterized protein
MAAPTKTKTSVRGRFLWYELQTTDVERAKTFYGKVMDWGNQPMPMDMPYTILTKGETPLAGLMELPPHLKSAGVPPHWIGYLGCDDVDKAAEQAKKLGATVHMGPEDIPTVGRFAVIADPQGAAITLYTPANEPLADKEPELGQVSWHELMTTDYKAAWRFYQELFGWEEMSQMDMGEMGVYFMFGRNGRMLGGMMTIPPGMPMPPNWCYYVMVQDSTATAEVIKANGGTIINGPMEVPSSPGYEGDMIAQATDPQGAVFAVHSRGRRV